jgi:hypothetical protein
MPEALCLDSVFAHPINARAQNSTPSAVPIQYRMPRRQPVCALRRLETFSSRFSRLPRGLQLGSVSNPNDRVCSSMLSLVNVYYRVSSLSNGTYLKSSSKRTVYAPLLASASCNIFGIKATDSEPISCTGHRVEKRNPFSKYNYPREDVVFM